MMILGSMMGEYVKVDHMYASDLSHTKDTSQVPRGESYTLPAAAAVALTHSTAITTTVHILQSTRVHEV